MICESCDDSDKYDSSTDISWSHYLLSSFLYPFIFLHSIESSQFFLREKLPAAIQEGAFIGIIFIVSHLNARSSSCVKKREPLLLDMKYVGYGRKYFHLLVWVFFNSPLVNISSSKTQSVKAAPQMVIKIPQSV